MQAVVLAGGFGTRMRPLTYFRPKPLLPVANVPLIQRVLDRMPAEVDTVILPVNYLRQQVEAYFEERPDPRVVLVAEEDPLGTGGAIANCEAHLSGPFLVYNGDIVASVDLADFAAKMRARSALAGVTLWQVDEPWHFGVVELQADDRISRFVEKPPAGQEPSKMINAGQYYLDPVLLDRIDRGRLVSLEREVYEPMAAAGEAIFGHPFDGFWVDCGRPSTLLEAHRVVLEAESQRCVLGQDARISASARVVGYAVGDECVVDAEAHIERSCLLPRVEVGAKARVTDSVVGEGAVIEAGAVVEKSVVGDYAVIEQGARIISQQVGLKPAHVAEG